jgi:hypothetical protein
LYKRAQVGYVNVDMADGKRAYNFSFRENIPTRTDSSRWQ